MSDKVIGVENMPSERGLSLLPSSSMRSERIDLLPNEDILTADQSWPHLDPSVRNFCAVTSAGRVFLSNSHRDSGIVRKYLTHLVQSGVIAQDFSPVTVSISVVRSLNSGDMSSGSDSGDHRGDRRVWRYLTEGYNRGASHIHFSFTGDEARLEIRVNQILHVLPHDESLDVFRGMMDVLTRLVPRDAGVSLMSSYVQSDKIPHNVLPSGVGGLLLRVSPLVHGGQLVVCQFITDVSSGAERSLRGMGFTQGQQRDLLSLRQKTSGIVLFSGRSGSGKTTTMKTVVTRKLGEFRQQVSAMALVASPETGMPMVRQVPIPRGATIQQQCLLLKDAMQFDADVLVLDEVSESQIVQTAFDVVLSGAQVMTTLRARSWMDALMRLSHLGVSSDLLTNPDTLGGVVAQRLVPSLCPHCRISLDEAEDYGLIDAGVFDRVSAFLGHVNLASSQIYQRGKGCPHCRYTKYIGTTVLAEVLLPNRALLKMVVEERDVERALRVWTHTEIIENGPTQRGIPMQVHALSKMLAGVVGPQEVELGGSSILWEEWMQPYFVHRGQPGVLMPDLRPVDSED